MKVKVCDSGYCGICGEDHGEGVELIEVDGSYGVVILCSGCVTKAARALMGERQKKRKEHAMKFEIGEPEKGERPVRLWLEKSITDGVCVMASNGETKAAVVYFSPDGALKLCRGVAGKFGFRLAAHGEIVVELQ